MKRSLGAKAVVYPTPVFVVGTYDTSGRANIMAAAWGGICCSRPPCVAISLRKATYTYESILAQRCFTVSIPSTDHVREADYVGIYSGREEDKFAALGLTPVRAEHVNAPYVAEFPFILECRLLHVLEIGLHTQFVGEIVDIKAEEGVLTPDGVPDVGKIRPFSYAPDPVGYYALGRYLGRAFSIGKELKKQN